MMQLTPLFNSFSDAILAGNVLFLPSNLDLFLNLLLRSQFVLLSSTLWMSLFIPLLILSFVDLAVWWCFYFILFYALLFFSFQIFHSLNFNLLLLLLVRIIRLPAAIPGKTAGYWAHLHVVRYNTERAQKKESVEMCEAHSMDQLKFKRTH